MLKEQVNQVSDIELLWLGPSLSDNNGYECLQCGVAIISYFHYRPKPLLLIQEGAVVHRVTFSGSN